MAEEEYRVIHENNTIMDIRKILNKLSEEELEVLKSELDNDIEDAIDSVIDLKNQPSLFGLQYKAGDVFVFKTYRAKYIVRIQEINNPHVHCERIVLTEKGTNYDSYAQYKVDDFNHWTKVSNDLWDKIKSILEHRDKAIYELKMESVRQVTEILNEVLGE